MGEGWDKHHGLCYFHMDILLQRIGDKIPVTTPSVVHEYGCSVGDGTNLLHLRYNCEVKGFDTDAERIEEANRMFPHLAFEEHSVAEAKEPADLMFCLNVIEEYKLHPVNVINSLKQLCKYLIIETHPDMTGLLGKVEAWIDKVDFDFRDDFTEAGEDNRPETILLIRGDL